MQHIISQVPEYTTASTILESPEFKLASRWHAHDKHSLEWGDALRLWFPANSVIGRAARNRNLESCPITVWLDDAHAKRTWDRRGFPIFPEIRSLSARRLLHAIRAHDVPRTNSKLFRQALKQMPPPLLDALVLYTSERESLLAEAVLLCDGFLPQADTMRMRKCHQLAAKILLAMLAD